MTLPRDCQEATEEDLSHQLSLLRGLPLVTDSHPPDPPRVRLRTLNMHQVRQGVSFLQNKATLLRTFMTVSQATRAVGLINIDSHNDNEPLLFLLVVLGSHSAVPDMSDRMHVTSNVDAPAAPSSYARRHESQCY